MQIKDFKASLEYLFKAEVTPFVWGHAGIGKSTVVKQYADEKGYKFFPFYLGTQSDLGDILGLAEFVEMPDGSKATDFAIPKWLKDTITYCNENPDSGAIIFLDEFNRARRDILNGMFSLALDKTFHTLKLPKNCHLVAAGNPPTDDYITTDVNETALMARFAHIKLEPSFQEWLSYAKSKDFEPTLISFLQEQPELLEEKRESFVLPVKVDRRAYERINRLFKVGTPASLLDQLMTGIIGMERCMAYKLHLTQVAKPLTGAQVLSGEGLDIVKEWSNPIDIKSSYLSITCDNLFDTIKTGGTLTNSVSPAFTEAEGANLLKFLETLPRELSYTLMMRFMKSDLPQWKDFVKKPEYQEPLVAISKEARGIKK